MFCKLIESLKSTSSIKGKQAILATANDVEKNLLRLTYDPMMIFNLSEIDYIRNQIDNSSLRHLDDPDIINESLALLKALNERTITGNEARNRVRDFISNKLFSSDQELFAKIINKDLKVGVSIKTLNSVYGDDFIKELEIQLANKYQDFQKKSKFSSVQSWYENAKLDGHRFYIAPNGLAFSRNGKTYAGMDHILNEVHQLQSMLSKTKKLKNIFIDGELYSQQLDFNTIAGKINSNKNFTLKEKELIDYHIFVIGYDGLSSTKEMVDLLDSLKLDYNYNFLKLVPYSLIPNDFEVIKAKCCQYMEQGFEGIMLRDESVWYDRKRSDALLKYKLFKENDFIVKDVLIGTRGTKFESTLGSFECYGKLKLDSGEEVDVSFNANFKGTYIARDRIWKDRAKLIGSIVEVTYQDISQNADGRYSLRFPYVTKLKTDR